MATEAGDGSQKYPREEVLGVGNDGEETCSARNRNGRCCEQSTCRELVDLEENVNVVEGRCAQTLVTPSFPPKSLARAFARVYIPSTDIGA